MRIAIHVKPKDGIEGVPPWKTRGQFEREMGKGANEVAHLWRYVVIG